MISIRLGRRILVPFQGRDLHGSPYVDADGRTPGARRWQWSCEAGGRGKGWSLRLRGFFDKVWSRREFHM